MLLPLIFISLAALASAIMAYGTHPSWAQYSHGLDLIVWSRKYQWPLISFALVMCIALLAMIVSGKRRAWWLIGLAPIVALFAHRFHLKPDVGLAVVDGPRIVEASADALADDCWVVGVMLGDQAYALPYPYLFHHPVLLIQDREKKWIVIWSAYANRATVFAVDRDLRGRDLEVVSTPANSVLIYNARLGEFIVGVTGRTVKGAVPGGFRSAAPISKMTWGAWRSAFPQSKLVFTTRDAADNVAPARPILPRFPMPDVFSGVDPNTRVALVQANKPAAVAPDGVADRPINFSFGDEPVLLFRDSLGGPIRAYDRRVDGDLFVRFKPFHDPKKPAAVFTDEGSGSLWSRNAVAIEGGPEIKGKKLARLLVEDDLYWGVMKYWYRDLQLYEPK